MIIEFSVKSSGSKPYKVTFQKNEGHVYAGCDCQARKSGIVCKHILNILDGDVSSILSGGDNEIEAVNNMIEGTRFNDLFNQYKAGINIYNSKVLTEFKKAMVTKLD